jgi:hypothetical protein
MSKGRTPPPRQSLADRAVVAEAAQAIASRPGLWIQQIFHDRRCKAGRTERWDDCSCEPDVRLVHFDDLQKERR